MDKESVITRMIEVSRHCYTLSDRVEANTKLSRDVDLMSDDLSSILDDTLEMLYDLDTDYIVIQQYDKLRDTISKYPIKRTWEVNKEKIQSDFQIFGSRFLKLCERM
jgi:hypothetical protein